MLKWSRFHLCRIPYPATHPAGRPHKILPFPPRSNLLAWPLPLTLVVACLQPLSLLLPLSYPNAVKETRQKNKIPRNKFTNIFERDTKDRSADATFLNRSREGGSFIFPWMWEKKRECSSPSLFECIRQLAITAGKVLRTHIHSPPPTFGRGPAPDSRLHA